MHIKISSAERRPFCVRYHVLIRRQSTQLCGEFVFTLAGMFVPTDSEVNKADRLLIT